MPRKKMGGARKQKRKNNLDEAENKNNQSLECRVSARRDVIPNSRVISDRRRSLRSSKTLFETGNSSLPVCSHRKRSRRHSSAFSAPDDLQQLDASAATIINSACQVPEGSDVVESPSKNPVQVVYPLTVEPHLGELGVAEMPKSNHSNQMVGQNTPVIVELDLGHNEAENVEKSTVREKLGELGEAGMSGSNYSNQMGGQINSEAGGIPLEHEPLKGEIQASNKFEEITVQNNRKCISRAGCSSPSVSLNLTEMIGMVGEEDDDDDADSDIQSWPDDTVNGYHVKPEFMPILKKIIGKHGDIAKDCTTKSMVYRSGLLEMICGIISDLDKKDVSDIKGKDLKKKISLVDEIKIMEVEVEWLHTRLTEILEARQILKQSAKLKEKLDINKEFIEVAESALKECETAKKKWKEIFDQEDLWKERLSRSQDECTKTYQEIKSAKSSVKRFLNCSLIDDLL